MADRSFLEWPFFDDHHREMAKALEPWCAREIRDDHGADVDAECRKLVRKLAEGGLLNCAAPDPLDPKDKLDVRSLCLIRETLARHSGLADFAFAMQGLGSGAISLFGSPELKRIYLPEIRKGRKIAAFALSEPEAGSDVASLATTAVKRGPDYVLNGRKAWISNGGIADIYTVFARTGEGPGSRGLSAFVVEAKTPQFVVADRVDVMAPHPLATLDFAGAKVPATNMLGKPGDGFKIAMATLDVFRPTVGAAALGFARRALDEALRRSTTRELYGKPLSDMQMTQAKLAEMALGIDASALLVYRAAWAKDRGAERITREAAMAKLYATESAQKTIDDAVQLFGALGVVSGTPVERLYREIRALRIYEGASEVQLQIIARQVLGEFTGGK
jgi:acyl-CoA dehydrogenase